MDDDGLILNLAQDETHPIIKSGVNKRGGRWTERLKAKRSAKRKARPTAITHPDNADEVPSEGEERKQKRRRVEKPSAGPKHIVSSLFTNNPKIDAPTTGDLTPRSPTKPSNAPLDSSTFTGLGLDPLLVAHLTNKMKITKPTSIQRSVLSILLSSNTDLSSRDVFIQSQTGSGKTLSFLLPIIQDLLPLSSLSYIDRSIGTLAIIIAPTRELAKQISDVLDTLLKMRLRIETESSEDNVESSNRMTRWLISGVLTGGATRNHEKARLRKGVPILVSTPGRLLDHIQNTSSFNVGKCRWLVLDEADRLMELGFEETINGILDGLDGRRRLAMQVMQQGKGTDVGDWEWRRRRTVLCSATIREDVQKLSGRALSEPLMIKATAIEQATPEQSVDGGEIAKENFTPPSQLTQKYLIVPLKLRLVTLVALLRTLLAQSVSEAGTKIIVFFSCTDSVDFHWNLFGGATMEAAGNSLSEDEDSIKATAMDAKTQDEEVETACSLLPGVCIYRLHGSLSTRAREKSLRRFVKPQENLKTSSILFCTSVASRGLDLPLVRAVVQYDLPTEGGATEYIHRVGRTARAGGGGEAWCFIAPSENEWVKWIEVRMRSDDGGSKRHTEAESGNMALASSPLETILKKGFGGKGQQYESRATQVQVTFERWVLQGDKNAALARNAYLSHLRAYATHPSNEKHIFHVKHLHLGHLAKAFALREAPASVASSKAKNKQNIADGAKKLVKGPTSSVNLLDGERSRSYAGDTEKKMQKVVRAQGKLTKKGGMMVSSGASEFQIAGGDVLERMVQGN